MIEVVADGGGDEDGLVHLGEGATGPRQLGAAAEDGEHHLRDAEAVPEVVERVRGVPRLHGALERKSTIFFAQCFARSKDKIMIPIKCKFKRQDCNECKVNGEILIKCSDSHNSLCTPARILVGRMV